MLTILKRHPESQGGERLRVEADVTRPGPGLLDLRYALIGEADRLRLPRPTAPDRTDGLWRHTCFEAFMRNPHGGYYELNLAPSTQWAAYRFDDYRTGMANAEGVAAPTIDGRSGDQRYAFRALVDVSGLPGLAGEEPWRMGVSVILEDGEGALSYWALAHAPGKPDFHHPDAFALELPLTDPA